VAQGAPTADQMKKLAAEGFQPDPAVLKASHDKNNRNAKS
jgi:hypothetical protein